MIVPGLPQVDTDQAMAALQQITHAQPELMLGTFMVVVARIAGMFAVIPFFGSNNIPMMVRTALVAILSAVITPIVYNDVTPGVLSAKLSVNFMLLLGNQVLIGLFLGLVVALVFYGIEAAGNFIDSQRGAQMTAIVDPSTGQQTSTTGQFLNMLAVTLFVTLGGATMVLKALVASFQQIPATNSLTWLTGHVQNGTPHLSNAPALESLADFSGGLLQIAVKIAAPVMLSIMLSDTLLGIINRAAPQVNVFALSMPIKSILGVAALFFSLTAITGYFTGHDGAFASAHDHLYTVMRQMRG